jgi:hypothetical protein
MRVAQVGIATALNPSSNGKKEKCDERKDRSKATQKNGSYLLFYYSAFFTMAVL